MTMAQSPCLLPLPIPFCFLPISFTFLETLLGVLGSRPPWSQVARKLTSPFSTPPHSPLVPNSQHPFSDFPNTPRHLGRQLDPGFQSPEQLWTRAGGLILLCNYDQWQRRWHLRCSYITLAWRLKFGMQLWTLAWRSKLGIQFWTLTWRRKLDMLSCEFGLEDEI